jgi:tRNA G46 methylase TrmB
VGDAEEFGSFNAGYADWYSHDGIMLRGHSRNILDRYRVQMYHHLIWELGRLNDMSNKTLVETGCGRGGGLNYLTEQFKPKHSIGIDMNQSSVRLLSLIFSRSTSAESITNKVSKTRP